MNECVYLRHPTLSKRSETVQQRGVEIHSPIKCCRSEDHRHVGSEARLAPCA